MQRSRQTSARDLASIAAFAAFIAVLGMPGTLYLFGSSVPVSLQTLGVMLAGSILGWRRGAIAVLVFLLLVAAGLPLLASGRGGLGVFVGASAGYLLAWPLGAAVVGWLVQRRLPAYPVWWGGLANVLGGIVVIYLFGIPVQAAVQGVSLVTALGLASMFLVLDSVKVVVATGLVAAVHRGYPAAFPIADLEPAATPAR